MNDRVTAKAKAEYHKLGNKSSGLDERSFVAGFLGGWLRRSDGMDFLEEPCNALSVFKVNPLPDEQAEILDLEGSTILLCSLPMAIWLAMILNEKQFPPLKHGVAKNMLDDKWIFQPPTFKEIDQSKLENVKPS